MPQFNCGGSSHDDAGGFLTRGTRREFLRRTVAASALGIAGIVSLIGFEENRPPSGSSQPGYLTGQPTSLQQATTVSSSVQAKTETVTVTVTGHASQSTQTLNASTTASQGSSTSGVPTNYFFVAALSALSGRTSAYFNHPDFGTSILVNLSGEWKAFSGTCTHQPCTVEFTGSSIYCPCHGGTFSPVNGAVQGGPPPSALPEYGVLVQGGNLYVSHGLAN